MASGQDPNRVMGTASRRDALKLAGVLAAGGAAAVAMSTGLPATPAQAEPSQTGPGGANGFSVEINGQVVAGVQSVDEIETESNVVEYKSGTGGPIQVIPGDPKPGTIRISKDWTSTKEFFIWRKTVLDGKTERKSISVIFHNDAGEASRINFYECWPSKWTGPSLNARNSGHATETIEVVWETIELK